MRKLCVWSICVVMLTGCMSVPEKELFAEPIVYNTDTVSLPSNFDLSYSMHYQIMNNPAKDRVSIRVRTMLYDYRFDFSASKDIANIFNRFLHIAAMAENQQRKNGFEHLAESTLHAYAYSGNTVTRILVDGTKPNWLGFSFLLKDGERYLVIDGFKAESLSPALPIKSKIESIVLKYDDVKKMNDFLREKTTIEEIRKKHRVIQKNAIQPEPAAAEHEISVITLNADTKAELEETMSGESAVEAAASEKPAESTESGENAAAY